MLSCILVLYASFPVTSIAAGYYIAGGAWNGVGKICEMTGVYGNSPDEAVALHIAAHNEATGLSCTNNPCCCAASAYGFNQTNMIERSECGGSLHPKNIYSVPNPKNCPSGAVAQDRPGYAAAVGNPVNVATGNKHQVEVDVSLPETGLSFKRYYNSSFVYSDDMVSTQDVGAHWRSGYSQSLVVLADSTTDPYSTLPNPVIKARRANGRLITFNQINGQWQGEADVHLALHETPAGYAIVTPAGVTEDYELYSSGKARLVRMTEPDGRALALSYNAANQLDSLAGPYGHVMAFRYAAGRLAALTDPTGAEYIYAYDGDGNPEYVYYPDGSVDTHLNNPYRRYHYEKPASSHPHALTGISDLVGGQEVRYATYDYDTVGRATLSHHAQDAGRVDVVYNDIDNTRTVYNSRGLPSTYRLVEQLGVDLVTEVDGPGCTTCPGSGERRYYDTATNNRLYREGRRSKTKYGEYDGNGNYHCMIEGISLADTTDLTTDTCTYDAIASPDARVIRYGYGGGIPDRIASVSEPSVNPGSVRVTSYTYDGAGNRTSVTIAGYAPDAQGGWAPVARTTTWKYGGPGQNDCPESEVPFRQLCEINGPRDDLADAADITRFRYWSFDQNAQQHGPNDGRLREVEDAAGNLIRHGIHYTATGKILYEYDANNVMTRHDYYPGSDRLRRIGVTGGGVTRYTLWTYLETGEVVSITTAHGSVDATTITFGYDDARRLVSVADGLGNSIRYTLDTEGNVIQEAVYDANGTPQTSDDILKKSLARVFNVYNQPDYVWQGADTGSPLQTFDPETDADGNVIQSIDGNNVRTAYSYDDLGRLLGRTQELGVIGTGAGDAVTAYGHDARDRLARVVDPDGGVTTYSYDDLGNLITLTSPDTGVTYHTYDEAGNMTSRTVAAGTGEALTSYYSYDAANRPLGIRTSEAQEDIRYTYDSCQNGAGQLCSVSNGHVRVAYAYDSFGNVVTHQGIGYSYDNAGRVSDIDYPSGARVSYSHDAAGRVVGVSLHVNGQSYPLADGITYAPFGDVEQLVFGNGSVLARTYDTAYRPLSNRIPGVLDLVLAGYDGNGNPGTLVDAGSGTNSYSYDALGRLTVASGPFSNSSDWTYGYSDNGNRIQMNEGVDVTLSYGPDINRPNDPTAKSNRLAGIGSEDVILSVTGNTIARGVWNYSYTPHQRLREASDNYGPVATYAYNGLGQRVAKKPAGSFDRHFFYGLNGELLVETDAYGRTLVEYFYLNGRLLAVYHPDADNNGETNLQAAVTGGAGGSVDSDLDGLYDSDELLAYGTLPGSADTDGDGLNDGAEITWGTDPLDSSSFVVPGDINADGLITLSDYLRLLRCIAGLSVPTAAEADIADLNRNGILDAGDAVVMLRAIMGLTWNGFSGQGFVHNLLAILGGIPGAAEAAVTQGALYYVHTDHLGTPQVLTDESGGVVWRASYAPFGKASIPVEMVEMNVRFPGQYYDLETGLHYNYFRYYDPATGRYITSDPIGLDGGLNTYLYAYSNSVKFLDPEGLAPFCPPGQRGVPAPNYKDQYPDIFVCRPYSTYSPPHSLPRGPFGPVCGPENSGTKYWIPDVSPDACRKHDECYDSCAKSCEDNSCKYQCDDDLKKGNWPYGKATEMFGGKTYNGLLEKYGCENCGQ